MNAHVFDVTSSLETDISLQLNENDLNDACHNVNFVLNIYLCMFVTNCKGERSLSKLKLILNYLRNTMGKARLSSLALLGIENELLRKINFDSAIDQFAKQKARNKDF